MMQTALNMNQAMTGENVQPAAPLQTLPRDLGIPGGLPSAEAFFWGAITSHSLSHGYVLKGKNTGALYNLALTIAKIVNCQQRPEVPENFTGNLGDLACGKCKECRWVEQNAHPAVLTISRLTYQIDDSKEVPELLSTEALEKLASKSSWPTLIKTGQVERLIRQLGISSDATRVITFTDAEELPVNFPANTVAPSEWRSLEATQDRSFHIRPLQRNLFNAASVNRFLKTLEEPPPRTLFFFLADTEEQLLETVVSRCQTVPCFAAEGSADGDTEALPAVYEAFLRDFFRRLGHGGDAFAMMAEFEQFFGEEQGLKTTQALEIMQQALRQHLKIAKPDEAGFAAYRSAQLALDEALRMIAAKTNEGQSLLNLFITLTQVLPALHLA
jgi:hypothetical protein